MQAYRYGLLGQGIGYSRSPELFKKIWAGTVEPYSFELIDTDKPENFIKTVIEDDSWGGFTVTTPYKVDVLPFLNLGMSSVAQVVGAVNVVRRSDKGLMGHNSDVYGCIKALEPLVSNNDITALILGTGGAAKAVKVALHHLDIKYKTVSRNHGNGDITYDELDVGTIRTHHLIINATPLGSGKQPGQCPTLPYDALSSDHKLFDLTYTPAVTPFLQEGLARGAIARNGLSMLWHQAVEAWQFLSNPNIYL